MRVLKHEPLLHLLMASIKSPHGVALPNLPRPQSVFKPNRTSPQWSASAAWEVERFADVPVLPEWWSFLTGNLTAQLCVRSMSHVYMLPTLSHPLMPLMRMPPNACASAVSYFDTEPVFINQFIIVSHPRGLQEMKIIECFFWVLIVLPSFRKLRLSSLRKETVRTIVWGSKQYTSR